MNFPNSPTSGQVYTPYTGGPVYQWDSTDGVWRFATTAPVGAVPDAPFDGKVYVRENAVWVGIPKISAMPTAPGAPDVGDLWLNTSGFPAFLSLVTTPPAPALSAGTVYLTDAPSDSVVYGRENGYWVGMPKVTASNVAPSSPDVNDIWFDTSPPPASTVVTPPPPPGPSLSGIYITDVPSDNVVYGRENANWVGMPKVTTATTAPGTPDVNDLWVDTT